MCLIKDISLYAGTVFKPQSNLLFYFILRLSFLLLKTDSSLECLQRQEPLALAVIPPAIITGPLRTGLGKEIRGNNIFSRALAEKAIFQVLQVIY